MVSYPRMESAQARAARSIVLRAGSDARRRRTPAIAAGIRKTRRPQPRLRGSIGRRRLTRATRSTMPNTIWLRLQAVARNCAARAATGSARYLMQTNRSARASLRTRWRRWRNRWSCADGLVDPGSAHAAVLSPRIVCSSAVTRRRHCSNSRLARIAFCCTPSFNSARAKNPPVWNKWTR